MKKIYVKPSVEVMEIENQPILAGSPKSVESQMSDGSSLSYGGSTDDEGTTEPDGGFSPW